MLGSMLKTMFPRPGADRVPVQDGRAGLVLDPQPQGGARDTVVTFLGHTRSRALDGILAAWGPALERRGWKHRIVHGGDTAEIERMFADGLAGTFAFAYGFAGIGAELEGSSSAGTRFGVRRANARERASRFRAGTHQQLRRCGLTATLPRTVAGDSHQRRVAGFRMLPTP
jgi:hypothetical protein